MAENGLGTLAMNEHVRALFAILRFQLNFRSLLLILGPLVFVFQSASATQTSIGRSNCVGSLAQFINNGRPVSEPEKHASFDRKFLEDGGLFLLFKDERTHLRPEFIELFGDYDIETSAKAQFLDRLVEFERLRYKSFSNEEFRAEIVEKVFDAFTAQIKREVIEESFRPWVEFFFSDHSAKYSGWLVYLVLTEVVGLAQPDYDRADLVERSEASFAPVPMFEEEALDTIRVLFQAGLRALTERGERIKVDFQTEYSLNLLAEQVAEVVRIPELEYRLVSEELFSRLDKFGLNEDDMEKAIHFTEQTLLEFPPDRYMLVNWGVSTTLVDTILREMFPQPFADDFLISVPLVGGEESMSLYRSGSQGSENQIRRELIDKLAPGLTRLNGRDIVVTRALYGGITASRLAPVLQQYASDSQVPFQVNFNFVVGAYTMDDNPQPLEFKKSFQHGERWKFTLDKTLNRTLFDRNPIDLFALDWSRSDVSHHFYSYFEPVEVEKVWRERDYTHLRNPRHNIFRELVRDYLRETGR